MRVLLLSQHFWPESFRINEVAQSLLEQGCEVTVLTGKPNYPEGRIFDGYRAGGVQAEAWQGMEIVRVPLVPRGGGGAWRLVLNYLSFIASASVFGARALRGRRFDVVFVYASSPILQVIAAIVLRRLKRAALVTWVQDLWPDSLAITGYVRSPRLLAAVGHVVRWIYRHCDLLLVQSHGFAEAVRPMAGGTPVAYHPNPAERTAAGDGNAVLRLKPGFNIVFAGNLGTVQALETVLDAAELLGADSGIRWWLIGSGARSDWLVEQVRLRGLVNVELPGRFEPRQMPAIYAQADALLVSLHAGEALARTIPSKVQTCLSAGRPILAALSGEGAEVVRRAGAGLCCAPGDAQALAEAASALRDADAGERDRMAAAGLRCAAEHFAPATLAERLVTHFRRAIEGRHRRQL